MASGEFWEQKWQCSWGRWQWRQRSKFGSTRLPGVQRCIGVNRYMGYSHLPPHTCTSTVSQHTSSLSLSPMLLKWNMATRQRWPCRFTPSHCSASFCVPTGVLLSTQTEPSSHLHIHPDTEILHQFMSYSYQLKITNIHFASFCQDSFVNYHYLSSSDCMSLYFLTFSNASKYFLTKYLSCNIFQVNRKAIFYAGWLLTQPTFYTILNVIWKPP